MCDVETLINRLVTLTGHNKEHIEMIVQEVCKTITAQAVPAGYALVPIEPTEKMLRAYKKADGDHSEWEDWLEWDCGEAKKLYKAMIKAAEGRG